jgi:dCMP deaminase
MICAGISEIYIDHHGFEKDFAQRRFQYFLDLSLPLAARAGVNVYKADSQERICALLQPADSSFGSHITRSTARYDQLSPDCKALTAQYAPYPWAGAQMGDVFLSACAAPSLGVTEDEVQQKHTKYSLMLQPLTRILMIAARGGQRLYPHSFVLSRIPTAREMVDFVGAGYDSFRVISPEDARDSESRQALNLLTRHKIIDYKISEL